MTLHRIKLITKPFWVPAITAVYLLSADQTDFLVLAALFFGYLGDLFLMRPRRTWFVTGAFAFLIGHLFYAFVFFRSAGGFSAFTEHPAVSLLLTVPYIGYLIFMKKLLGDNVKSIFIPAAVYLSVLSLMSYCALLRFRTATPGCFLLSFLGSILFIISDSLIGIRNFKRKFRGIGTVIVITYIAAQLLIVLGLC